MMLTQFCLKSQTEFRGRQGILVITGGDVSTAFVPDFFRIVDIILYYREEQKHPGSGGCFGVMGTGSDGDQT
jgi:hypothetical protein